MKIMDIRKYANAMTQRRTKCKCGHSVVIPTKGNKVLCSWCGNYVFKDKKTEFKYRLKEEMHKEVNLSF